MGNMRHKPNRFLPLTQRERFFSAFSPSSVREVRDFAAWFWATRAVRAYFEVDPIDADNQNSSNQMKFSLFEWSQGQLVHFNAKWLYNNERDRERVRSIQSRCKIIICCNIWWLFQCERVRVWFCYMGVLGQCNQRELMFCFTSNSPLFLPVCVARYKNWSVLLVPFRWFRQTGFLHKILHIGERGFVCVWAVFWLLLERNGGKSTGQTLFALIYRIETHKNCFLVWLLPKYIILLWEVFRERTLLSTEVPKCSPQKYIFS